MNFSSLLQDLRFGLRVLMAKPGFAVAAVLTLALGIGANAAVFSVVNALLLKPLPYTHSDELVEVYNTYPNMNLKYAGTSIPDYLDRREQATALADIAIYHGASFNLAAEGRPQRLNGQVVSPSLFNTLSASALVGRVLADDDAQAGKDHVVVLGYNLWKNQFAGDPSLVGREIRLNGESYRVVGVMPDGFFFPNRSTQMWTPFAFTPAQRSDKERGNEFSNSVARLKPGATISQLDAQLDAIVHRNADRIGNSPEGDFKKFIESSGFTGRAITLRDRWIGDLRPTLWLLQLLVGCVMLIACANVANLMLTRLSARQKELSVRAALGAGIGRIARQLLAESVMLAVCGGVVGLALAYAGVALINRLGLGQQTSAFEISIDGSVLVFSFLLALATGVIFGLVPVLSVARGRLVESLKEGGRGNSAGIASRSTRNVLVVVQTAMAVALLVVAGLLIRSFFEAQRSSPGFSSENVLSLMIDLPKNRYADDAKQVQFYDRLLEESRALPGVKSAGLVSNVPFSGNNGSASYHIEGKEPGQGEAEPHGFNQMVDEDFFKSLEIPVIQGRSFSTSDTQQSEHVVIIDKLLADRYFPNENPLGKRIAQNYIYADPAKTKWSTIVGVVGTVKRDRLTEDTSKETLYYYYKQQPSAPATMTLKTELSSAAMVNSVRDVILKIDPEQPVFDILTMDERIHQSLDDRRTPMLLLLLFAGVALALSAVGIYGVLAFAVAQRTGEMGVRLSLGAQPMDILKLVMSDGGRLTGIGIAIGLIVAIVLGNLIRTQLFGVGAIDPLTFLVVVTVIAGTAFFACWLPARRAARVSPIVALRYE